MIEATIRVLSSMFVAFIISAPLGALAKGAGPVGVWAFDHRYAVVADKSIDSLLLVDLVNNLVVDVLRIQGVRPIFVSSCYDCKQIYVAGHKDDFLEVKLKASVKEILLSTPNDFFSQSRVQRHDLSEHTRDCIILVFCRNFLVTDGRAILTLPDGTTTYSASSNDESVFVVSHSERGIENVRRWQFRNHKPFGLNWGTSGNLLLTMHKKLIYRITQDGVVLKRYNVLEHDCPGAKAGKPNLRAALDAPGTQDALYVLASNPLSYDAVVWKLFTTESGERRCMVAAGGINREPGWLDGVAEKIYFSRPHHMIYRPGSSPAEIIVSDIDNRALRIINTSDHSSRTIFISNGDVPPRNLKVVNLADAPFCSDSSGINDTRNPDELSDMCKNSEVEPDPISFSAAQDVCREIDADLCSIGEIQRQNALVGQSFWISNICASCWLRNSSSSCDDEIVTFRSSGTHGDKGFQQSWNSGAALMMYIDGEVTAKCVATDTVVEASVLCCQR